MIGWVRYVAEEVAKRRGFVRDQGWTGYSWLLPFSLVALAVVMLVGFGISMALYRLTP